MKIAPLIVHSHHIDFFENLCSQLEARGHKVLCFVRKEEGNIKYLKESDLNYTYYGPIAKKYVPRFVSHYQSRFSLMSKLMKFRPDLSFSVNAIPQSTYNSILNIYSVVFLDRRLKKKDEKRIFNYADKIVTPDCYPYDVPSDKHLSHPSYHPFTYLHPNNFDPDDSVLVSLGVEAKDYVFVSFARESWGGFSEDLLLSRKEKMDIVRGLAEHRQVFVDGRGSVPEPLEEYVPSIPVREYNHLLANSELVVGDDPIICSEAGVLGVPWLFIGETSAPTLEEQEIKYEIGSQIENVGDALELAEMLLTGEVEPDIARSRREILNDKIDLTKWILKFVEIYERRIE
ncbi:MAG: hypothetical protein ACLFSM_07410 [Thermoplasmata archaeon]